MTGLLEIGQKIPSFEAKDPNGELVSEEDLLGAPFIIYFYPKDDTPGCTQQACSFRDELEFFEDRDIMVIGISPDNGTSHQAFIKKFNLNFPLLTDTGSLIAKKFGIIENGRLIRSAFLCDEDGIIQWMEKPVNLTGHIQRLKEAIEENF